MGLFFGVAKKGGHKHEHRDKEQMIAHGIMLGMKAVIKKFDLDAEEAYETFGNAYRDFMQNFVDDHLDTWEEFQAKKLSTKD